MTKDVHRVGIVVDKNFEKNKLRNLSKRMHVWLIESTPNKANANDIVKSNSFNKEDFLADGITVISSPNAQLAPASILDDILDEIDEHHNEHSHSPGWSEAHVFGVMLDNNVKTILNEFGFSKFSILDNQSFVAKK